MSEHVKDMIDAVINQDAAEFLGKFETAINTKVASKLESLYPEVAHQVMNPSSYSDQQ